MWDLIVSVTDHCLSFYFTGRHNEITIEFPDGYHIYGTHVKNIFNMLNGPVNNISVT